MIGRDEITRAGEFRKPHGVRGEIGFTFTEGLFDGAGGSGRRFVFCEIDGLFVPFCIDDCRLTSCSSGIMSVIGLDSVEKVRLLANRWFYVPDEYLKVRGDSVSRGWRRFLHYVLVDDSAGVVGTVSGIDSSTLNTLFVVSSGASEFLVPAAEEFIVSIDESRKVLTVNLPSGLLDLSS
ncbi:MAG: 16S rRNA processing protein RimM [Dysgonamonadaceae bacterium]|jgi:16S rRNA processing protein RimM|nr:16S rRNA processing protein RimM [Dysgonamonadaceae bacterium]